MTVRPATAADIPTYVALGRVAQAWLTARGLGQYVPAAHPEYADAIAARVPAGTLFAVEAGGPVGFFSLDSVPSPWWPVDGVTALYLGGMVVDPRAKGRGVGGEIIRWCMAEAARRGCDVLRLDCHAGNPWLCGYYERHGFVPVGRVEQHPGYDGCLYQLAVTPAARR